MRRIKDSVVVVTGASSGIGWVTALEFARRGARVTLAARRDEPLDALAHECERAGGQALVVPADVTDEAQVKEVARRTVDTFGRLDIWVNNAAVTVFGAFEQTPMEAHRQVIETNLFGYMYGAAAALPYFRKQGSGVLINNASMVARLSEPYVSAYVISKHGIRGLAQSLRQELYLTGGRDIHVCTVMPATIDTPFFQHAGNFAGRKAKAMSPVYPPERVARAIIRMAQWPRREMWVGNSARIFALLSLLAPGNSEKLLARMFDWQHMYRKVRVEPTLGNLVHPMAEGAGPSGGWKPRGARRVLRMGAVVAGVLLPAAVGWAALRPRMAAL